MPKLTDTMQVAELGILFVVVIYLLGFSGVVVAANLLNNNRDFQRGEKLQTGKKAKEILIAREHGIYKRLFHLCTYTAI